MKFCMECGTRGSEQAEFCKKCGMSLKRADREVDTRDGHTEDDPAVIHANLELEHESVSPSVDSSLSDAQSEIAATATALTNQGSNQVGSSMTTSVAMSRRQKLFILLGMVLLAALFAGYKVGEYFTSEDRLIGQFENALESSDYKAAAQLLSSKDERLVIDEKTITGFMNYLDQNQAAKKEIIDMLREQARAGGQAGKELLRGYGLSGIVNLEKNGKMLLYDKYKLTMAPVYVRVETNYAGTVLLVNGQQAAVADVPDFKMELGPYVPGLYRVEAKYKNEFVNLHRSEELQLLEPERLYNTDLKLAGEVIRWDTRFSEQADLQGRLYINGKKLEINPFDNHEFGPVTTDGSMTLVVEADLPWGTVKSAEVKIEDHEIFLDFTRQDSFQKSIKDTIVRHAKENLEAFASGDTDKLTLSTDKYKDVLQNVVTQFKESGYAYKSNYIGTVFDMGSIDLDYRNDVWQMTLITQPLIEAATYTEGETPSLEMQEAYSKTGLIYDDEQGIWKVDFISNTWGFKTDELEQFKEEKPITFESAWQETAQESAEAEISTTK